MLNVHAVKGEVWVRGSAAVLEASGGVTIDVSADGASYDTFEQPVYFPGIFSCRAEADGSAIIHTSNKMTFSFSGEGLFSVERFEGLLGVDAEGEDGLAENQSRIILNLRRGELLIDSRSLSTDSKLLVETPVGRISGVKAVLQIRIEYDYRSGIYDFTISCVEGMVRLVDLRKQVYLIYAGQRIAGAGVYAAPAIEVVGQTDQVREKFDRFFVTMDSLDLANVDQAKLRAYTQVLANIEKASSSIRLSTDESSGDLKRPRVIKFAPRPEPITPFRGELKPPSDYQADLF